VEHLKQVNSVLINKIYIWLGKLARNLHSSVLQTLVNYERKSFLVLALGACLIKLFPRNYFQSEKASVFIQANKKRLKLLKTLAYQVK
jgi:hypothetical protein